MDLHASSAWYFFVVRSRQRDRFRSALTEFGIETDVHYPIPPHRQPAYAELALKFGSLPVSEQLGEEVLNLSMLPMLEDDVVSRVIAAVRSSM